MKIQKNIKWAAAIAVVCLAAYSASAKADYIGCNFVYNDASIAGEYTAPGGVISDWTTNVDALAPTETAGVPPLCVQVNWNNLGRFGTNVTLNDSNGTPTSVKVSWFALGMFDAAYNASYPSSRTNDTKLMDGFIECTWNYDGPNVAIPPGCAMDTNHLPLTDQPIVFLTGLNSFLSAQGGGTYSIIIYVNTDGTGQGRVGQYFIHSASGTYDSFNDTGTANEVDGSVTPPIPIGPTPVLFAADTNQFDGSNYTMVPLTATNSANAAYGNYVEFDGLTNDTILIRTQNGGSPGAPINAIQILSLGVAIPPNATRPVASPGNTVYGNSPVTLNETATGTPPLTYQWQTLDNTGAFTNIPNANTNTLSLFMPDTGSTYTNQYIVILTNIYSYDVAPFQATTSQVCYVTVLPASQPILTANINIAGLATAYTTNVYGFIGGNVTFSANFGLGTMPITNQWLLNNAPIPGANSVGASGSSWTITNVTTSGNYSMIASNSVGSSNSSPAYLTALADPAAPSSNGTTNMYAYCVYTNHPWAYWRFEETTNTLTNSMQAYDYSGHNFDATYGNSDGTSGAGCKDGGLSLAAGIYGPGHNDNLSGFPTRNGCATLANGKNNGYLTVPPLNLNTNTVTFTMWIYINPNDNLITPYTGLLMNRNGSDAAGIGFGGNVTTNDYGVTGVSIAELGYTWNHNSAATYGWHSGLYPAVSTWNFVACTMTPSSTTMYLYFVGQDAQLNTVTNLFKASTNIANAAEAFNGGTTWIGSDNWNNGNTFDGYIDEVAVFTNALTEAQIQDLFLRGLGMTTGIAPIFTVQPTNETIFQNQTIMLTATASGIPAPWYQWQYESGTTWSSLGTAVGRTPNASTLLYSNWTSTSVTNFRCTATNFTGAATSSVAVVTTIPIVNYNKGLWTVNFAVATTSHGGPGTPYVGPGLLGTNTYWNAVGGNPFENATSLRDDGSTHSGVMIGVTNASVGTFSSGQDYTNIDNALLDQYAQVTDTNNGMNFFFTQVPNGRYNLALYGCTAAYADRGAGFTVYTNGVSAGTQWITNKQDTYFMPYDNAVVYTNLVVTNGMLQVNESIARVVPAHTNSTEADFNGAQLELITYGPNVLSLTNSGTNLVLTYAGGFVLQSTNVTGPWTTNTTVGAGAVTINPTGQLKFYRVWTNKAF